MPELMRELVPDLLNEGSHSGSAIGCGLQQSLSHYSHITNSPSPMTTVQSHHLLALVGVTSAALQPPSAIFNRCRLPSNRCWLPFTWRPIMRLNNELAT